MKVIPTSIPEVVVIEPKFVTDARGSFRVAFHAGEYEAAGIEHRFVQDNVSVSRARVLRGLHLQFPNGQGKLIYALRGEIFDVAVDVRVGSPSFGRAVWVTLSEENHRQLYIPPGFAHGFVVTSDEAIVTYKCSALYSPGDECTIRWNDPALGIPWPVVDPVLVERDATAPLLEDVPVDRLPRWS